MIEPEQRLDLVHVPIPLSRQGSTLMKVAQAISDVAEAGGMRTGAVLSHNRSVSLRVAQTFYVDYTRICPREWFTRAELAQDFAVGALGGLRPHYGHMFDPAVEALEANPPKAILLYDGHYAAASLPRWQRLRDNSTVILYVHNPLSRSYGRRELRRLLAHADRVVFCADHLRADVERRLGGPDTRLVTVPNGISPPFFTVDRAAPSDPFTVVYTGRVVPNKGVHLMLEAVELARSSARRPLRALVVGSADYDGTDSLTPYELGLREQAARMTVPVEFVPFSDQADVVKHLERSAVACLPSVWAEGLPLAALEAMATGLPVVTSDSPGMVEATAGAAAIVPRGDPEGLAREIARLADSPDDWHTASAASRARSAQFGWRRVVAQLLQTASDAPS